MPISAKKISDHYNLYYLDTGKIYRYIAYLKIKCIYRVPHIRLYIFNEREIAREKAEGHSTMHST